METVHVPVLLYEVFEQLVPKDIPERSFWYLDGTLGGAGHAKAIAKALNGQANIVGLDRDPSAIERAKSSLKDSCQKLILEVANFKDMDKILEKHGLSPADSMDAILLDLGLSSDELEHSWKGFSFQKDEPLIMTMGDPATHAFTAADILNGWTESAIADVIYAYGEETFARRIARAIVAYREKKKIESTHELAEIVKSAVPSFYRYRRIHPATKTFQALRIAVNDELTAVGQGLEAAYAALRPGGRLGVISFHSLEDRIVKDFMRSHGQRNRFIGPSDAEISANPRSRSAKLRIIEKPFK